MNCRRPKMIRRRAVAVQTGTTGNERPKMVPCRQSRHLLAVLWAVTVLSLSIVTADHLLRASGQERSCAKWMQTLGFFAPALWPAGSLERHPELSHPAVDGRFCAGLGSAP